MAMSAGEVKVTLTLDAETFKKALKDAGLEVKSFGDQTEKTAGVAAESGNKTAKSQEDMAARTQKSAAETKRSMADLGLGFAQVTTAAFSLYSAFDNIEKKQYAVEKATLAAQKADETAREAKEKYDEAVANFGESSAEAEEALIKLNLATDTAELADQRAEIAQGDYNEQLVRTGLQLIPTVITGIDGMSRMWKSLKDLGISEHLGGITTSLKNMGTGKGGPLGGAIAGVGALSFAYMAFTAKTPEMRAAFSILAGAMLALAMAQWASNIAAATGLSMTGVGLILVAAGIAAAAAMYLLSSQYGAPADQANTEVEALAVSAGTGGGAPSAAVGGVGGVVSATGPAEGTTTVPGGGGGGTPGGGGTLKDNEKLLFDWLPEQMLFRIARTGLKITPDEWSLAGNRPYESMYDDRMRIAWLTMRDVNTKELLPAYSNEEGDIYMYGKGGWAGMNGPEVAVLGESGPERVLSPEESKGAGQTNNFYVNGARDVDLVVSELMRRLRFQGGTPY